MLRELHRDEEHPETHRGGMPDPPQIETADAEQQQVGHGQVEHTPEDVDG